MASDYTREWIHFFRGCGIPDDVAARYGLIFKENRIQKNMLLDLNKEYLRDMGITIMGDIIAILRHAKVVHDKYIREQIIIDPEENSLAENNAFVQSPAIKKSTPAKGILEHCTRKTDSSKFLVPHEKVQICIENEKSTVNVPKNLAHRVGVQNKGTVRQRIKAPSVTSDDSPPEKLEVPVPKFRRVFPENEGSYSIKMPSGSTERSKKLLEMVKVKQNKTVFDRLGESSVSSTSDVSTSSGTTTQTSKVQNSKEKSTVSVFSRLGEKSPLVTSTSSSGNTVENSDQLPYKGILKTKAMKKKIQLSPNSTMRADSEFNLSSANNPSLKKISLVKERLGTGAKTNQSSQSDSKANRFQIATTSEEKKGQLQRGTLMKSLKSLEVGSEESVNEKKNLLDGLGRFRSETSLKKSNVTSTTQKSNVPRGLKRGFRETETPDSQVSDITQSKKVRFGKTTHRLIPGNDTDLAGPGIDLEMSTLFTDECEELETRKLTLKSGVRIGPMNSDKVRPKLSLKDRIGLRSLSFKSGKMVTDIRRKRSLKFNMKLKKAPITVHDRLG